VSEKKSIVPKILLGVAALGAGACVCGGGSLAAVFMATRGEGLELEDIDEYPPPPGNPKGSFYVGPPDAGPPDTGPPIVLPLPANPKGSTYDQGPLPVEPPPSPTKKP
jgi:hypothetical protein